VARVVGHRAGKIVFVGDQVEGLGLEFLPAPEGLLATEIQAQYEVRRGKLLKKDPNRRDRIALVSVYDVPCGIATYSKWLWDEMKSRVDEARIFAEEEKGAPCNPDVVRCWRRGEPLTQLVAELKAYDPDIIYVQHEFGNFPNARHWLAFMGALSNYRVVVTLHSVYRSHRDKIVIEASCPEIIVHTPSARASLVDEKQLSSKVHVIPHGCSAPEPGRLWNIYHSEHTVLQFGFGFPYKGWENAIEAVATIKEHHPDVFYTGLMSERWPGVHADYAASLNAYAEQLGVAENIGIIRGFQSDAALDAFLRTNRVALFPYRDNGEHTVQGCSGAARVAMSKGTPVVASGVPLFEDLDGVVPRPSTVEGWASAVMEAFDHNADHVARQDKFLVDNSWAKSAERYLSV
jgi:glycosyltransferase involved in cell wall biosynthesis